MNYLPSLEDIANRVVSVLQEGPANLGRASSQLSKDRVVDNINSAYSSLTEMGHDLMRPELLVFENAEVDPATGALDVLMPTYKGRLLGITIREPGSLMPTEAEYSIDMHRIQQGGFVDGSKYYRQGSKLIPLDQPRNTAYRVWYLRYASPLSAGTAVSATDTTLVIPASPSYGRTYSHPHVYVRDTVLIVDGTGVGQERTVSGYDPVTRTLTLDSAWVTTPDATSKYSFTPWFPPQHTECLAYMAAQRFTRRETAQEIIPIAAQKLQDFRSWLEREDMTTSFRLTNTGRARSGLMGGNNSGGFSRFSARGSF